MHLQKWHPSALATYQGVHEYFDSFTCSYSNLITMNFKRHLWREVAKIQSYFQVQNHWELGQCTGEEAGGSTAGKLHTDMVFIYPMHLPTFLWVDHVWTPSWPPPVVLHTQVKLKLLKKKRMVACFGVNNLVQN